MIFLRDNCAVRVENVDEDRIIRRNRRGASPVQRQQPRLNVVADQINLLAENELRRILHLRRTIIHSRDLESRNYRSDRLSFRIEGGQIALGLALV